MSAMPTLACRPCRVLLVALLLGGCSTTTELVPSSRAPLMLDGDAGRQGACGERYDGQAGVQLSMIQQQLDDDRPRAALAYLDSLGFDTPEARLLRGEALRLIGERELADLVYRDLLDTCLVADGYRGLARTAAARGDLAEALVLMGKARDARPADPRIRNDLGYLLLLSGEPGRAREQFLTALEIDERQRNAAHNLVLALLQEGELREARRLAVRYGVDEALLVRLEQARLAEPSDWPHRQGETP